jgi:hypothetical protein
MDCHRNDGWLVTGPHVAPQAAVDEGALLLAAGQATAAGEDAWDAPPEAAIGLSRAIAWAAGFWLAAALLLWSLLS